MRARLLASVATTLVLSSLAYAGSAATLPESDQLAKTLAPYLAKPLPSVESLVGVAMHAAAPLLVVGSLGDDEALSQHDRGYAVGFTLNELLFDADPRLDVVAPWYYAYDTRAKNAPRAFKRDSAANAYRVAARDHARWCAHGRVRGVAPARIEFTVDACSPGDASHQREWVIGADSDWPTALAEMCEFASTSATGELTARAKTSCSRARDIRPSSLMALARYGGTREYGSWKSIEAMVAADPKFAPAVIEYVTWIRYDNDRNAFWNQVTATALRVPQSSAVQLHAFSRLVLAYGWKIENRPYPQFFAWVRDHSYLSAAWLGLASGLSSGTPGLWPADEVIPSSAENGPPPRRKKSYPPNEATHSASLALSLAIYRNWPQSYRSLWMMGYALQRYGWMLRGSEFVRDAPQIGKRGFPVFISWADRFNDAALELHPEADTLWIGKMVTTKLDGGDWLAVFDRAVEVSPHNAQLYEDAMSYAVNRWGGNFIVRGRIESVARAKNPNAEWARTLRERWEKAYP